MKKFDYKNELLFEEYMCIEPDAHHKRIRFYENRLPEILALPFDRCMEIRLDYALSLYNVGAYQQFVRKVDALIKIVIEENIYEFRGKDIYHQLLFMKAMSHYRNVEYKQANHVFESLLKINKRDPAVQKAYYKCKLDQLRSASQALRGLSIALFLVLGIYIAFDLLIVRSFYSQYIGISQWIKGVLAFAGLATLGYNELKIRITARKLSHAE